MIAAGVQAVVVALFPLNFTVPEVPRFEPMIRTVVPGRALVIHAPPVF